jgi:hypothetical protein
VLPSLVMLLSTVTVLALVVVLVTVWASRRGQLRYRRQQAMRHDHAATLDSDGPQGVKVRE